MGADLAVLAAVHVFVVEDDANGRVILSDLLRYFGAEVTTADSARDALGKLRRIHPDVVVADVRLGDRNASWLLREARRIRCEAPFVAVTAYDYDERALRLEGFASLLHKPLDRQRLIDAVMTAAKRL